MTRYIKGRDGKFQGAIGSGTTPPSTPDRTPVPQTSGTPIERDGSATITDAYEAFQTLDAQPFIDEYGNQKWTDDLGRLHRDGGLPAVITPQGDKRWCVHGEWHRDGDLPAYEGADGTLEWWQHNKKHRVTDPPLPAVIRADGTKEYWENGHWLRVEAPDAL